MSITKGDLRITLATLEEMIEEGVKRTRASSVQALKNVHSLVEDKLQEKLKEG